MSRKAYGTFIEIGDVLVSEDVILEYFACIPSARAAAASSETAGPRWRNRSWNRLKTSMVPTLRS